MLTPRIQMMVNFWNNGLFQELNLITIVAAWDYWHIEGLVQDCSNFIANALELLQSCTKPLIWYPYKCNGLWFWQDMIPTQQFVGVMNHMGLWTCPSAPLGHIQIDIGIE